MYEVLYWTPVPEVQLENPAIPTHLLTILTLLKKLVEEKHPCMNKDNCSPSSSTFNLFAPAPSIWNHPPSTISIYLKAKSCRNNMEFLHWSFLGQISDLMLIIMIPWFYVKTDGPQWEAFRFLISHAMYGERWHWPLLRSGLNFFGFLSQPWVMGYLMKMESSLV